MKPTDFGVLTWHKSSRSGTQENCVEVAYPPRAVALRDSKNPEGPALVVSPGAFASFLRHLR